MDLWLIERLISRVQASVWTIYRTGVTENPLADSTIRSSKTLLSIFLKWHGPQMACFSLTMKYSPSQQNRLVPLLVTLLMLKDCSITEVNHISHDMDSYLTFVNRGLDGPVREMILEELTPQYSVELESIGEYPRFDTTGDGQSYPVKLKELLQDVASRKRQRGGSQKSEAVLACCSHSVGVVSGEGPGLPDEGLGYNSRGEPVWCTGGNFAGVIWLRIRTDAPPIIVSTRLRCLGPLLALVDFQNGANWNFGEEQDMESLCQQFEDLTTLPSYNLDPALLLWQRHVTESWPLYQTKGTKPKQISTDLTKLRFRLSCTRAESKKNKVKRQDLLRQIAKFVAPDPVTKDWTVNLNEYDIEIVIALRPHCVAVGFALKPHQYFGKGFAAGLPCPPDISPPHLPIQHSDNIVRLRPNNAQILLHLANLQTGMF